MHHVGHEIPMARRIQNSELPGKLWRFQITSVWEDVSMGTGDQQQMHTGDLQPKWPMLAHFTELYLKKQIHQCHKTLGHHLKITINLSVAFSWVFVNRTWVVFTRTNYTLNSHVLFKETIFQPTKTHQNIHRFFPKAWTWYWNASRKRQWWHLALDATWLLVTWCCLVCWIL